MNGPVFGIVAASTSTDTGSALDLFADVGEHARSLATDLLDQFVQPLWGGAVAWPWESRLGRRPPVGRVRRGHGFSRECTTFRSSSAIGWHVFAFRWLSRYPTRCCRTR